MKKKEKKQVERARPQPSQPVRRSRPIGPTSAQATQGSEPRSLPSFRFQGKFRFSKPFPLKHEYLDKYNSKSGSASYPSTTSKAAKQ